MNRHIFRAAALDRLSSPDRLDQLIRVTTPRGWLALIAFCGLIAVGVAWFVWGQVPTTIHAPGILLAAESADGAGLRAVGFAPLAGGRIQPGMAARVVPVTVRREEFGFIHARVAAVSAEPATRADLARLIGNELLLNPFTTGGAPYIIEIQLDPHPDRPGQWRWSTSGGPPYDLRPGTVCEVEVVINRQSSLSLLVPSVPQTLVTD